MREYLRLEILYAYPTWQAGALLQAGKCHELLGEGQEAAELYQQHSEGLLPTPRLPKRPPAAQAIGRRQTWQHTLRH